MQNPIKAEQYKGMEQVKITEWGMEQMEITMNPHGTIVYSEWTHEIKCRTKRVLVKPETGNEEIRNEKRETRKGKWRYTRCRSNSCVVDEMLNALAESHCNSHCK